MFVILVWKTPQSCAHWPVKVPGVLGARNQVWFVRPGIASVWPPSVGTHQAWTTSAATMVSVTTLPTGTSIVSIETWPSGYVNSQ